MIQPPESLSVKVTVKKSDKGNKPASDKKKDKGQKESKQKETRSCHWCKKSGHLKKNCFAWKRKQAEADQGQETAALNEVVDVAAIMNVTDRNVPNVWIMDSRCTFHVTPNRNWISDMEPADGTVLLGNDHTCKIQGVGNVRFRMKDGSERILSGVRYILSIKRNLISLGLLEHKGFTFSSGGGKLLVMKGSDVLMQAERRNIFTIC